MADVSDTPRQVVLPQLYYENPNEAVEWLCRVFAFTEDSRMSGPGGVLYIAVLRCPEGGNLMVSGLPTLKSQMQQEFPEEFRDVDTPWPNLFYSITVMVPDVDEHFALARSHRARIVTEPADQPWGLRDYEVVDLEGRQWNFSQHLRDTVPEDWGATSSADPSS